MITFLILCGSCNRSEPETINCVEANPANENASVDTIEILSELISYSCSASKGVLSGQNTGHGNQIADPTNAISYQKLVAELKDQTGQTPAVLGLDYGHDKVFTLAELQQANGILIDHWNSGGIITINWVPQSPWNNSAEDPENYIGDWLKDTRTPATPGGEADGIILNDLIDPSKEVYSYWRNQLDIIASALQELQDAGVVVLWRPIQEMDGDWFWWGTYEEVNDAEAFINVWQDMFQYFTEEKQLNNLLWVYSPTSHSYYDGMQRYPGSDYVDVIAGTTYNDSLSIADYEEYLSYGKPIGMGEFGPGLSQWGGSGAVIDNTLYATRLLNDYPAVAYWVSWHSYEYSDERAYSGDISPPDDVETTTEKLALIHNNNSQALFENRLVITLEKRSE